MHTGCTQAAHDAASTQSKSKVGSLCRLPYCPPQTPEGALSAEVLLTPHQGALSAEVR